MDIPKTLKIGGHEYKVIFPYSFTERGDRCADHDSGQKTIRIDDKDNWSHEIRPESSIAVSFLHEILHACDYQCGNMIFDKDKVESQIEALSETLYQILHDNKLIF